MPEFLVKKPIATCDFKGGGFLALSELKYIHLTLIVINKFGLNTTCNRANQNEWLVIISFHFINTQKFLIVS